MRGICLGVGGSGAGIFEFITPGSKRYTQQPTAAAAAAAAAAEPKHQCAHDTGTKNFNNFR